jgi:hypothetical protein
MQADQFFIAEHFDPGEAIGVGPDWIEDAREIRFDVTTPFFQQVRKKKRHFMSTERPFRWIEQLIPVLLRRWHAARLGDKLVPRVEIVSAFGSHRAGEDVQQHQRAHRLPTTKIS